MLFRSLSRYILTTASEIDTKREAERIARPELRPLQKALGNDSVEIVVSAFPLRVGV